MADVLCCGDLLIDFVPTQSGLELADVPAFERAAGGAAANVAVGLARLGAKSAFMGKVGDDAFGHYLGGVLEADGVDISPLRFEAKARTALAFVTLKADGERDFLFYRHPSADMLFRPDEVDEIAVARARIFHFDSISLASSGPRRTVLHAADLALAKDKLVSYDVNLRLPLWESADAARTGIRQGLLKAHMVKLSEDELEFLTGSRDPSSLRETVWHDRLRFAVLTLGGEGCILLTPEGERRIASFDVKPVDTTGAGDGFVAGLLEGVVEDAAALGQADRLARICRLANAVGALTTTRRGAIPALPTREQVEALMNASPD